MWVRSVCLLAVAVAVTSCGSRGAPASETRDRNVLTPQEIEASVQNNAYDLVRTLRPRWLRVRGPNSVHANQPVTVYVDGVRYGGPGSMRSISTLAVEEIRFYTATDAQARFGLNNTNGVIAIRTRRR